MIGRTNLSRREFVVAGATALLSVKPGRAQSARALTAQQVIDRIRSAAGVPWLETTVDTFKAGDPNTVVTGIATTVMATLDVLRRAAAAGHNLIITHEPTFYAANDSPGTRATDPVYLAKKAFLDQHQLIVWRFSDHWLARTPNEFARSLAETLGWTSGATAGNELVYTVPPTTLRAAAALVRTRLALRGGMRVVGDPDLAVRRVLLIPGSTDLPRTVRSLPSADLIVCGEPREWEAVEYVFDSAAAAQPKGMIAVGRIVSEEPGMRACAAWVRTLVGEVPVEPLTIGDVYWRPTV